MEPARKPPTTAEVLAFLDGLRQRHAAILPVFGDRKVLSFMGTASVPGVAPALALRRVSRLQVSPDGVLQVVLAGRLPRAVAPGERVAVSLTDSARYFGFQLKSPVLTEQGRTSRLFEERAGETLVASAHVFSVHPTEYVTRFFEEVPTAEVIALADQLRFALVSVGAQANVSPRFILHYETDGRTISLFHGDSALNKTYLNLQTNHRESRLVTDLESLSGLLLEGPVEPFSAEQHPAAAAAIRAVFTAAKLGTPKRMFRLRAERWAWADAGG
jgi:hypothetical protein